MIKHLTLDIILLLSVFIFPWWLTAVLAVAILFYLKSFKELVIFGLLLDIYYGFDYRFTIISVLVLLSSFYLKKRFKFFSR